MTNKKDNLIACCLIFLLLTYPRSTMPTRSSFREGDLPMQTIKVKWAHQSKCYMLPSPYFAESPFKLYDAPFLNTFTLPPQIPYRDDATKSILGKKIIWYIKTVLKELQQHKKKYTHFIVLQNKDFNQTQGTGLIVLKLKNYPFVVKIFIETPESFIRPFSKGFHPIWFFFMAGGVTRHLSGFTRIKNLTIVQKKIRESDYWSEKISLPRKWFWAPARNNTMEIEGINIGKENKFKVAIPGTYCIIADEVKKERSFSIYNAQDRKTSLELCNYLTQRIDSHIDNFMIEEKTQKIAIIDTEHFPSIAGLTEAMNFYSYTHWYLTLAQIGFKNLYGRTKKYRRDTQTGTTHPLTLTA